MATIASRDPIAPRHPLQSGPEEALAALDTVREQTLALVGHLSEDELSRVLSPIMSPLVWDLAHIAAYEDLWLAHRHGGLELLRPDLAEMYDAFETPRSVRGEIELLDPEQARAYLRDVRARSVEALAKRGVGNGTVYELVLRHELQHSETMRQTMALAGLLPAGEPYLGPLGGADEWIDVPAGPFEMGAGPDGFAYDNERPRHTVELPAFQIARRPVRNASWIGLGKGVPAGHPDAPVCHVSWFEAEEFARATKARLPTEAEWEKAAGSGLLLGVGQVWEWTSTRFDGYPGFVAHPYREYSEVFFGDDYRVLRGGSWATSSRVGTVTFRNWDHPIRRQIFAGVRLARDAVR
ncbi:MAG: SUMF1/EgtB/PvdO family nonheme iron enzyme [Solirubrobacteraceae bacterium]